MRGGRAETKSNGWDCRFLVVRDNGEAGLVRLLFMYDLATCRKKGDNKGARWKKVLLFIRVRADHSACAFYFARIPRRR